ncbi:TetR family transcriptional regulator C-terminal domain-containing protein [Embleya hyalina]|uniref:BetI-type transcriptional repressor C-terminal domain-containing protein n=1 Tax=Embleya hyalina TaxID=516124 RepID=A0A401Z1Z3_9ACTN|nr:TetR family transcriptional regulator C-terminal domain-containing protein [Embleya hyalina]GCE00838.1 hypothetical protein EHYA_08564 [Embleya hyalina]
MPFDDARRAEFPVRPAFAGQAAHDARLTAVRRETAAAIRERVAQGIRNGKECGEVDASVDADEQALCVVAFAEGPAMRMHADPDGTPGAAVPAAPDDHLARVFTGACRHGRRARRVRTRRPGPRFCYQVIA